MLVIDAAVLSVSLAYYWKLGANSVSKLFASQAETLSSTCGTDREEWGMVVHNGNPSTGGTVAGGPLRLASQPNYRNR